MTETHVDSYIALCNTSVGDLKRFHIDFSRVIVFDKFEMMVIKFEAAAGPRAS